jgi:hypothetical protein
MIEYVVTRKEYYYYDKKFASANIHVLNRKKALKELE